MGERPYSWLPWSDLLRFGVMELGLSPNAFWRLSLCEILVLLAPHSPAENAVPLRSDFDALMALFPDQ